MLFYLTSYLDGACDVGWPITSRPRVDSAGFTMVSPDKPISCCGEVTAWQYQAKNSKAFRAIVFSPVEGSDTKFRIVGINDIPAGAVNTPVTYTVPEDQRIFVIPGDVIGWSFGDASLAWNSGGSYRVPWKGGNLHASLKVDQVVDIQGVEKREYSIAAIVKKLCYGEVKYFHT